MSSIRDTIKEIAAEVATEIVEKKTNELTGTTISCIQNDIQHLKEDVKTLMEITQQKLCSHEFLVIRNVCDKNDEFYYLQCKKCGYKPKNLGERTS